MRAPYLDDGDARLYLGDCIEVMAEMDAESVDAVVCDPPYGIGFMGKAWDAAAIIERVERDNATRPNYAGGGPIRDYTLTRARAASMHAGSYDLSPSSNKAFAAWCETWAREAIRVLKPGGHLLAFGGTRTFHRLTGGIEDAGFEVRDCLTWLYGSGFPKSLDVSKAIDRAAGAQREVVGRHEQARPGNERATRYADADSPAKDSLLWQYDLTAPATDAAREWEGWATALKPAWEPCVVARKPLAGTVAENVQRYGTGAVNVDGCRIPHGVDVDMAAVQRQQHAAGSIAGAFGAGALIGREIQTYKPGGRWPANVVLDEQAAAMLDAQSGVTSSGAAGAKGASGFAAGYDGDYSVPYGDTGGASRFFYTAKASRADRSTNGANNTHPTVKPTDLMRWLVRLVTPPGGVVLDPFVGSGTTLVAARAEGVRCIGIEQDAGYAAICSRRLSQQALDFGQNPPAAENPTRWEGIHEPPALSLW